MEAAVVTSALWWASSSLTLACVREVDPATADVGKKRVHRRRRGRCDPPGRRRLVPHAINKDREAPTIVKNVGFHAAPARPGRGEDMGGWDVFATQPRESPEPLGKCAV